MQCPHCYETLRRDESLASVQSPEGMVSACPTCRARFEGRPHHPTVYPPGVRLPHDPTTRDGTLLVCPLCRRAMRYGDNGTALRVPDNEMDVEPGVYSACTDCLRAWAPAIRDKLIAEGVVAPGTKTSDLSREQLL